jgi:glutaminase
MGMLLRHRLMWLFAIVGVATAVLTARVPKQPALAAPPQLRTAVDQAYEKFKGNTDGQNADYIPALAKVPSHLFGISIVTVDGTKVEAGDTRVPFAIESVSKVFTAALVAEQQGSSVLEEKIGVDATGLPFNSVAAMEINQRKRTVNPLVNAGAMATASLVRPKGDFAAKWTAIFDNMSAFAGRTLDVNEEVYTSEAATNQHNQGIAMLLLSYNRMYDDPVKTCDVYTRQCSVNVTASDLAVMAATLANGGVNPVTSRRVVKPEVASHMLAVMATAGLYENTGNWLWDVGLPGKSGVGGGIIAVVPGKMGIGTFAPPLDGAGNSVKGQLAVQFLSETLKLNLFSSTPAPK